MNRIFTDNKTDKVVLNENFYMTTDGFRGIQLVNHYPATKKKKDKTEEKYIKEDSTYHANVHQALTKFIESSQKPFLPFTTKENFASAYTEFYKKLL